MHMKLIVMKELADIYKENIYMVPYILVDKLSFRYSERRGSNNTLPRVYTLNISVSWDLDIDMIYCCDSQQLVSASLVCALNINRINNAMYV